MPKKLLHGIDLTAPGGVDMLLNFHRRTFGDAVMEAGSEDGTTAVAGENNGQDSEFKAPASQADLDRIIQDRVARERAKYADYDDLKATAGQVETFQSRISELEATNGDLSSKVEGFEAKETRATLAADIAKTTGVPAAALRGNTREELEAHAADLAPLFKTSGPVIPGQERTPHSIPASPDRQFVGKLFGSD